MAGGSARAVTFTLNNWSESDCEKIQSYAEKPWCLNLIIGKEHAPITGTPHLQGYIRSKYSKVLSTWRNMFEKRAHIEIAKVQF